MAMSRPSEHSENLAASRAISHGLPYLRAMLQSPMLVLFAGSNRFGPGDAPIDDLVPTERLILLAGGRLRYTIADQPHDLAPPTLIYLPPHWPRNWAVIGTERVLLRWVEYRVGQDLTPPGPMLWRGCDDPLVAGALKRLERLHGDAGQREVLTAETLAKTVAGLFFAHAAPASSDHADRGQVDDTAVQRALTVLSRDFADLDAMERARTAARLGARQLRDRFTRATGQSPQQYLIAQRMHEARKLLHHADVSVKQTAAECGYLDPYYFSRLYRRFWGRSPSADRQAKP